jgi:hypothetical protein
MVRDFQDEDFVVEHVRGETVLELLGFAEDDSSHPQMMLVRLERSGWHRFFLSAFFGHWYPLDENDRAQINQDYTGVPIIDYAAHYGLGGVVLMSVVCARDTGGTSITMQTEAGTLVLREVDRTDPHSDSELLWMPEKAG